MTARQFCNISGLKLEKMVSQGIWMSRLCSRRIVWSIAIFGMRGCFTVVVGHRHFTIFWHKHKIIHKLRTKVHSWPTNNPTLGLIMSVFWVFQPSSLSADWVCSISKEMLFYNFIHRICSAFKVIHQLIRKKNVNWRI